MIGFNVHAELIKEVICNSNLLPITIGIFGDWGSGKTSILKMLERSFAPQNASSSKEKELLENTVCLYFNSWVFEGFDDAKSAIISSILTQLSEHKTFGEKVKSNAERLFKSVNWMRLMKIGIKEFALPILGTSLTGIPFIPQSLMNMFKEQSDTKENEKDKKTKESKDDKDLLINTKLLFQKEIFDDIHMHVRKFREEFEKMIEKSEIKLLVVLIDDLDRCTPERIVDNLEAIKLFLNVKQTAFVISADPRIVRHAVALRYKEVSIAADGDSELNEYSTSDLIRDYIEKLIQVPYYLPKLSPAEIETYMSLLFCAKELPEDKMNSILAAHKECWSKNRFDVFGVNAIKKCLGDCESYTDLFESLTFCSSCASLITEGLKGNPRQVKRFLNAFTLRKTLSKVAKLHGLKDDVLVKLMILEYSRPKTFSHIYKLQVSKNGYPKEIQKAESLIKEKGSLITEKDLADIDQMFANTFMLKWLQMKPLLSEVDLRDYFWVARDKLQSSLTGMNLVSPIVRKVIDDLLSNNPGKMAISANTVFSFSQDEIDILFESIKDYIKRNPTQKNGFDAIRTLMDSNVEGSIELFGEVLNITPSHALPAALGVDIVNLLKKGDDRFKEIVMPVIERLQNEKTLIGVAIKKGMSKGG